MQIAGWFQANSLKAWAGNDYNSFSSTQLQLSYNGGNGGVSYAHAIKSRHMSAGLAGNAIDFYLWQPGDPLNSEGSLQVMSLNGGKVGIGTTSPINGMNIYRYNDFNGGSIRFGHSGAYDAVVSMGYNASTTRDALKFSYFPHNSTSGQIDLMTLDINGKVGIGTTQPDYPLTVNGSIHAKEVRVDLNVPAPDYVFEKDYKLTSLDDIKNYIDQNKHLPEVPSAKEMEKNGVQLGEMNMILLKKIEELTLYVIDQNKKLDDAIHKIEIQQKEINDLKAKK